MSTVCPGKKDQKYVLRNFDKFARIAIFFWQLREFTVKLFIEQMPSPQLIIVATLPCKINWSLYYYMTPQHQNGQYVRIGLHIPCNCLYHQYAKTKITSNSTTSDSSQRRCSKCLPLALTHADRRGRHWGIAELAGLEIAGLENDGLENDGLENDGVEQEKTYILHTMKW